MDHFAARTASTIDVDLFSEIADLAAPSTKFQCQDFESAWSDKQDLSAEEQDLFPVEMESIEVDSLFLDVVNPDSIHSDPFLSFAIMDRPSSPDLTVHSTVDDEENSFMLRPAVNVEPTRMDHDYVNTPPQSPLIDDSIVDDEEEVIVYSDTESDSGAGIGEEASEPKHALITRRKKSRRGKRKPKANAWSMQKKNLLAEEAELEKKNAKLYEQKPFENPELERCRQNALNAKLNRERKKREKEGMAKEMTKLRTENQRLKRQEAAMKSRAGDAERELQRLRTLLRSQNLSDIVEKAKSCTKRHTTERAREACSACSLGNA
jgi:hypothetical protein